jgi:hypothetical protein
MAIYGDQAPMALEVGASEYNEPRRFPIYPTKNPLYIIYMKVNLIDGRKKGRERIKTIWSANSGFEP